MAFAEPMKKICEILFDLNNEQLFGNKKEIIIDEKRFNFAPRELMQFVGTDLMYHLNYFISERIPTNSADNYECFQIWVDILLREIAKNPNKKYVISDIRFIHESDALKNKFNNASIWKIVRNVAENEFSNHESETSVDNIINVDHIISNDDSKESLCYKIDEIMQQT
jgi:hypothetical protein